MSINISGLVNWTSNVSENTSGFINDVANLQGGLKCPFEPTASLNYNQHIIINFVAIIWLFLDMRYDIQRKRLGISTPRAERNDKLVIIMLCVYNTIFLLNQFVLIPSFEFLMAVYGL